MKKCKFKIFNTPWTLYLGVAKNQEGKWLYGYADSLNKEVVISTELENGLPLPEKEIELSTIHELLHAILSEGQWLQETDNEALVEWIAKCVQDLKKLKIL